MSNIPLIPALQFRSAIHVLEDWGLPSETIVARAGIPQWQYVEDSAFVPGAHFYRLMDRATRAVGDEGFATAAAGAVPIQSLGVVGKVLANSTCLNDALWTTARVYRSSSSASRYSIIEGDEEILLVRWTSADFDPGHWQVGLYALTHMVNLVRLSAGRSWRPKEVWLEGRWPATLQRLEFLADADMHVGRGMTGLTIPRSVLPLPLRIRAPGAPAHGDGAPPPEPVSSDFLGSLQQALRSLLFLGHPKIDVLSEIAGVNPRTLQRRLKGEGMTFRHLVDQARFSVARDLLTAPGLKLVEVACELGYADQAHFNRAFRRWAGVTPSEYRLLQQSG